MDENLRMAGTEARPTGHFPIKARVYIFQVSTAGKAKSSPDANGVQAISKR
jgi:hypothetical protein